MSDQIPESVEQQTQDATTEPTTDPVEFQSENTSSEETTSINPAWKEVLDELPEEFHSRITPKLSKWDNNFQEVQQKQAPYKELIDLGVPADDISQALQLRHLWNTNPRGVYEYLSNELQISQGQEKEESKEKEEEEYDISQIPDLEKDPRFQQMQGTVKQFEQMIELQRQQEAQETAKREITEQFQQAESKYGELSQPVREKIAKIAIANRDSDLVKAAEEYFTQWAPPQRASDSAPSVLGGNSGLPKAVKASDLANLDSEERSKRMAEIMSAMSQANE